MANEGGNNIVFSGRDVGRQVGRNILKNVSAKFVSYP